MLIPRGKKLIFLNLNQKKNQENQRLDQSNKLLVSVAQNINLEWKSSSYIFLMFLIFSRFLFDFFKLKITEFQL